MKLVKHKKVDPETYESAYEILVLIALSTNV